MVRISGNSREMSLVLAFGLITGIVVGGLTITMYFSVIDEAINLENNIFSLLQAVSNIVLVLVTLGYVVLTYSLVSENKRSREQNVKPVLNLDLEPYSIGATAPKIVNVGNGPAMEVESAVKLEPNGEPNEINSKCIPPGDFEGTLNPSIGSGSYEEYDRLKIEGEFKDMFGSAYEFEDEIDLEVISKSDTASSLMDRDPFERRVKRIERHLKDISDNIDMDNLDRNSDLQIRTSILEEFKKDGPLTMRELSKRTGMHPFELSRKLADLEWAGAIKSDKEINEMFSNDEYDVEIQYQGR